MGKKEFAELVTLLIWNYQNPECELKKETTQRIDELLGNTNSAENSGNNVGPSNIAVASEAEQQTLQHA